MSLRNTEKTETNRYTLTFDVSREKFNEAIQTVYRRQVKNITIPGFRKGKAPRAIIEKMYGKEVFYDDAVNEVLPDAYKEATDDFDQVIVSKPEIDVESIDDDFVVFTAKVYVKPEVKIEGYKGIPATRDEKAVTDKDVEDELERVQKRNSRLIDVTDRAAAKDDTVNLNYEGSVDGVPFEGGKAENHDLKLGSNTFIPGFEDQVAGHSTGDEFDVNVTFPEEYHASELAGKAAVFKCKINSIKATELPELNDEFASDVSDFETLAEYKEDIKKKEAEKNAAAADRDVEEQVLAALIEKVDADIPDAMYENETENFVRDYDSRLRMQGLDLKTYFQYTGMNLDSLRSQMRPDAEKQVKLRLAFEKIAELENLTVSDDEIEEEYKRLAEAYGMEADKIKGMVEKADLEADLKVKKASDLVKAEAKITKAKATKAAAEKKPAAKKTTAAKKTAEKAEPAEKKTTKSTAAKSTAAKATTAKKTAAKADEKKPAAKKPAAKKTTAKKAAEDKKED